MKINKAVWALLPLVLSLSGCDRVKALYEKVSPPEKPARLVFVLFDLSGSTDENRGKYLEEFSQYIVGKTEKARDEKPAGALRPGDRIIADKINENPLTQSDFPINSEVPKMDMMKDSDTSFRKKTVKCEDDIVSKAKEVLSPSIKARSTRILDSLQLAERVYARLPKYGDKVLVIFSDMVEESDINFEKADLSPAKITALINEKKHSGTLPNLTGVRVYVSGAGKTKAGGLSSQKNAAVQQFWKEYLAACGATLVDYGATLLAYESGEGV